MSSHIEPRQLICNFANNNLNVHELEFIRRDSAGMKITEISGGMINYIFRVQSQDEKHSVIIKYGEETMKLDSSEKVSMDRQKLEYDSLILMNSVYPGSAPKVFCLDQEYNILAIEDLSDISLLGDVLKMGHVDLDLGIHIGDLLATIHQKTSKSTTDRELWQDWQKKFVKRDQIEYYISLTLVRVLDEKGSCVSISDGLLDTFRRCVEDIKRTSVIEKICELFREEICFIHADCHWNSMFVKGSTMKIFDFEFAFLSHPAMQFGCVVGSYPPCMLQAMRSQRPNKQNLYYRSKRAIHNAVRTYIERTKSFKDEQKMMNFLTELALFTGQATWTYAIWVTIHLMVTNAEEEKVWLLQRATRLMVEHESITTVDKLVDAMFAQIQDLYRDIKELE